MRFSKEAVATLEGYHWPGNVRELENLVQRACVLASGNVILATDLPIEPNARGDADRSDLGRAAKRILRTAAETGTPPVALALKVLAETALQEAGNEAAAAKLLGVSAEELELYLDGKPAKAPAPRKARGKAKAD